MLVEKTTSKYRVPGRRARAAEPPGAARQRVRRRRRAPARAARSRFRPYEIARMADTYVRSQSVVMVSRGDVRRWSWSRPRLARLAAWRAAGRCGGSKRRRKRAMTDAARIHRRALHPGRRRRDLVRALASLPFRRAARRGHATCSTSPAARATAARCSRARAAQVTGADISPAAVDHARAALRGAREPRLPRRRIARRCRSPTRASTRSCSFETIEHIAAQDAFLAEIRRVLRPDGLADPVLPQQGRIQRPARRDQRVPRQASSIATSSPRCSRRAFRTRSGTASGRASIRSCGRSRAPRDGEIFEVAEAAADAPVAGPRAPAVLHRPGERLRGAPRRRSRRRVSVLADRDEWVHADYEKVIRDLNATHARVARRSSASSRSRIAEQAERDRGARERGRPPPPRRARRSTRKWKRGSTRSRAGRASRGGSRCRCAARGSRSRASRPGADRRARDRRQRSAERQDHRLVIRRLRVAIDANGRDARDEILAHEDEIAVELGLVGEVLLVELERPRIRRARVRAIPRVRRAAACRRRTAPPSARAADRQARG